MFKRSVAVLCLLSWMGVVANAQDLMLRDACRLYDSRNIGAGSKVSSASIATWGDAGSGQGGQAGCGVPPGSSGVVLSLTVYQPDGAGYARLWAFGATEPLPAAISFASGQTDEATGLVLRTGSDGKLSLHSPFGSAHFILDLTAGIDGGGGGSEGFPAPSLRRFLTFTNSPIAGLAAGDRLVVSTSGTGPFAGRERDWATWRGIPSCDPLSAACWLFEDATDGDLGYEAATAKLWRFRALGSEEWAVVGP